MCVNCDKSETTINLIHDKKLYGNVFDWCGCCKNQYPPKNDICDVCLRLSLDSNGILIPQPEEYMKL